MHQLEGLDSLVLLYLNVYLMIVFSCDRMESVGLYQTTRSPNYKYSKGTFGLELVVMVLWYKH